MTPRRPLPDSQARREERQSRSLSRWVFWGSVSLLALLVLAVLLLT